MTTVLMVVSAAHYWTLNNGTEHPTGFWAEELVEPHRVFSDADWEMTIATPGGKKPVVDRLSLRPRWSRNTGRRIAYLDRLADTLSTPRILADADAADFDLVFYPGGHAPMEDLAYDPGSGDLLIRMLHSGKTVALLCHGPAAALAAHNPDGSWALAGLRMTAFSNREERVNTFARKAPWLLETRLVEGGATYVRRRIPFAPFITVDRNLYTGQNPASAAMLAERLVTDLGSAFRADAVGTA
jgi:putative intracellular protease/amidase